jgi:hypothetical protein
LEATPGNHLVLVRYAPNHFVGQEWVYNAADIDHSRIVWAREIPGRDVRPLLEYFRDRMVWVVEADALPPKLEEYQGSAAQSDFPPQGGISSFNLAPNEFAGPRQPIVYGCP